MLKVQEFIQKEGLEKLKERYKIKVTEHPTDDRILLNYDQIESPKTAEIVRECRGLTLNKKDFSLISRSFRRFFNAGEWREDDNKFDWSDCTIQSKEDGSLIHLFYWEGVWRVQTRGSFGSIPFYENGPTPEELVFSILGKQLDKFDKQYSYALELCSRHNKIVRDYQTPKLYLLSAFKGEDELGYDSLYKFVWTEIKDMYNTSLTLPKRFAFSSIEAVEQFIRDEAKDDMTFEGCICRSSNGTRLKVKSPSYLALHRMRGNGDNLYLPKNLISFILDGETDELLCYFEEVKPKVEEMSLILKQEFDKLSETWDLLKNIKTRKDFALSIPKELKTKSLLFMMLDYKIEIKELWRNNKELLLKALF